MDLAGCTTGVVTCHDTPESSGVWPLVTQVVPVVLIGMGLWWALRHRRRTPLRAPQRRAHVSADGELLSLEDLPRG